MEVRVGFIQKIIINNDLKESAYYIISKAEAHTHSLSVIVTKIKIV